MLCWCVVLTESLGQVGISLRYSVKYHKLGGMDLNDRNNLMIYPISLVPCSYLASGADQCTGTMIFIHCTHPPFLQAAA